VKLSECNLIIFVIFIYGLIKCIWNGSQKMLYTMLHHQHNQNHCHFALRGKIFVRTLTFLAIYEIQFEPRRDSVNIFMIITRPPALSR
jgi:hypothetical protein